MSPLTSASIDTTDVAEVERLLRADGIPSRIETAADGADGRFALSADQQTDGELTLTRWSADGDWTLHAESDLFTVTRATTGTPQWSRREQRGDFGGTHVMLPPGRTSVVIDGSTDAFEVRFAACAFARIAADLQGVEHVRLDDGLRTPRSPEQAGYWGEVVQFTRRLFDGGLLADDRLRAALKTNLVATILNGFALAGEAREWRLAPGGAQAVYRRARSTIDGTARTTTAVGVARVTGLPLHLLDRLFRTQTGQGVDAALHAARIRGARAQLLRTEPTPSASEGVVRRWGFRSLEAFLPLHRRQYPGRALPFEQA